MGKIENMAHGDQAEAAESLQQLVNRRAYRLSQGQYQRYRRMLAADLAAGRIGVDGIDAWQPPEVSGPIEVDPMGDLPV